MQHYTKNTAKKTNEETQMKFYKVKTAPVCKNGNETCGKEKVNKYSLPK